MSPDADLDSKDIEVFFEHARLDYKKISNSSWQTTCSGETNDFPVLIEKNRHGLVLKICSYVFSPDDKDCKLALYAHLLKLNGRMHQAKFHLEKSGWISLSLETTFTKKNLSLFHHKLKSLCAYADKHYLDVLNMAQSGHKP